MGPKEQACFTSSPKKKKKDAKPDLPAAPKKKPSLKAAAAVPAADADVEGYMSRLSRGAGYTPEGYFQVEFTLRSQDVDGVGAVEETLAAWYKEMFQEGWDAEEEESLVSSRESEEFRDEGSKYSGIGNGGSVWQSLCPNLSTWEFGQDTVGGGQRVRASAGEKHVLLGFKKSLWAHLWVDTSGDFVQGRGGVKVCFLPGGGEAQVFEE